MVDGKLSKRDRVTIDPFKIRIALSTRSGAPTKTVVNVLRGNDDQVTLKFEAGPRRSEIIAESKAFTAELERFAGRPWAPNNPTPPAPDETRTLQNAAAAFFLRIFRHKTDELTVARVNELRYFLDHKNLVGINFDSDVAGIPLDSFHYGAPGAAVDLQRFIGARAPIVHAPRADNDYPGGQESDLRIGFLGTNGVQSVRLRNGDGIFAAFERLRIPGDRVHEETPLKDAEGKVMNVADIHALFRTWARYRPIWHITSHTQARAGQPVFVLDNGLEVRADFLNRQQGAKTLLGQPLMFLNLCAGTQSGIVDNTNFPDSLNELGAGGVIATHCLVHDRFATHFAERFYSHALIGDFSVGKSLFRARRDSLRNDGTLAS
jgi:hypothetical protein